MADVTQVVMPQLGETVTEGTITRWLKQSGDEIAEDEDLFEVSTDKVDTTVPSAVSGVVLEILVPEGDTVEVGVPLALIGPPGSIASAGGAADASVTAAGAEAAPNGPPNESSDPGRFLSPVVRRLLAEYQLDPAKIAGTGADGRITRDDVMAAVGGPAAPGASRISVGATTSADAGPRTDAVVGPAAPGLRAAARPQRAPAATQESDEVIPLSTIRKRIAAHLTQSLHTAAHALVVMEVDYSCVDEARDQGKAGFRDAEGFGLTYLPFVARAVVDAIGGFPHVNATIDGDHLVVHHDFHLGIAVDLDYEGLVVPVVHHADTLSIRAIAREINALADRARGAALTPDDIAGGTFTITNAGGYGTFITNPVINLPQVAILSTDGVRMRPVAVALDGGGYGVAVHPVGNLALSFDHRVFDGAYASAFLAAVVARLEDHDWLAELDAGAQHRAEPMAPGGPWPTAAAPAAPSPAAAPPAADTTGTVR